MDKTLTDIANEYVTQDNLGTAHPIAFVITVETQVPTADNEPGDCLIAGKDGDYFEFDSQEEIDQYLFENAECDEEYVPDADDYFDYIIWYKKERTVDSYQSQMFLTKSSIQEHIKVNKHHYIKPEIMLIHVAWRNPEMKLFINELYKHATVPFKDWNYEAKRYVEQNITNKDE